MTQGNMASRPSKPKQHPIPGALQKGHVPSFVNRYKVQQQKIQTLNQMEQSSDKPIPKRVHKSLPKIGLQAELQPDKENLMIRAVHRSNTMDTIKLPGVNGLDPPDAVAHKRKSLPVKTFNFRINSDSSFVSKSLPSLPSIPGSPPYLEDDAVSPITAITERVTEKEKFRLPMHTSKHKFENIVMRKQLHGDSTDWTKHRPSKGDNNTTTSNTSKTARPPRVALPPAFQPSQHGDQEEKPHTSGSVRIRYSRAPREADISETQSEPSFQITRKWKENCQCLRCQMLKRQFHEGDSHYGLWGRYPCHRVDPTVMLDD